MERNNFAVSSSTVHDSKAGPSSRKKPKIVEYEASDGSSSAVESDNNGSAVDSFDAIARNLLEVGCSSEQVAHAIEICGRNTPIDLIFDFIQATALQKEGIMERNNFAVSSSTVHDSKAGPSSRKKPKIVEYEASDGSSSAVESDNNGSAVDSLDAIARNLLEVGCSSEQVGHAIEICGRNTPIDLIFDFIQATALQKEVVEGGNNGSVVDKASKLIEVGCSSEKVAHAIEICGGNTRVEEIFDFIQAASFEEKVVEGDNNGSMDKASKLIEVGCLPEQVAHAIETCGENTHVEEIFDFIQATSFEKEVDSSKHEEHIELKLFQELEKWGFSSLAIKNAMETCESLDLQGLVNFILKAEKDELPHGKDLQVEEGSQKFCAYVEALENEEDIEFTPFQELRKMDFSSFAIKNAMETCESLNFEDLLSFLLEAEKDKFPNEEDLQVEETGQESHTYEKCTKFGLKVNNGAGPSKALITPVIWTPEKIKLWYTYIGLKQDFFTVSESGKRISEWKQWKKEKLSETFVPEKMMGFSFPGFLKERSRALPGIMVGPPYFYFENVASAPKFEWETIKRHLHGVDVEFVDSKFFSACRRPRGYVHNIPIATRKLLIPEPPMKIFEAFPNTQKYWPDWDTREKLNCINTHRAPDTLSEMIQSFFIEYEGSEIPFVRQQEILMACKRWNLMWVGPGQAAPLEPREMELLLGFDKDHTRGSSSMTARYTALGNAFQVNTVAYHLSPLKKLYPEGITVLSLFSGIGGAEVALHKCGITLKAVVAVENDAKTRNVIASWWKKSGQTGVLRPMDDVKNLTYEVLSGLIDEIGKIDLIIGGSPCNNLSGCNRVSRNGLSGKESSLFFEFPRILDLVKRIMSSKGYK